MGEWDEPVPQSASARAGEPRGDEVSEARGKRARKPATRKRPPASRSPQGRAAAAQLGEAERSAGPRKGKASEDRTGGSPTPRRSAAELAKQARDISVSEFFAKNRHLLGFDNPS